ncbi:MAG: CopG family transcriptional regulator [Micrococcales bacterium]|nr:CopG family transcriptional regulator [Micrococcales bacterium]MCL2667475.1 CopG family transcriptional regulator [Micrococcales bacterium]
MTPGASKRDTGTTNISVSLPKATAVDLRSRAGRRGISAYVTDAVEHKLAMERLGEIVADYEADHEPLTEAEIAAATVELFADRPVRRSA